MGKGTRGGGTRIDGEGPNGRQRLGDGRMVSVSAYLRFSPVRAPPLRVPLTASMRLVNSRQMDNREGGALRILDVREAPDVRYVRRGYYQVTSKRFCFVGDAVAIRDPEIRQPVRWHTSHFRRQLVHSADRVTLVRPFVIDHS